MSRSSRRRTWCSMACRPTSWAWSAARRGGPSGQPVIVATMADYATNFGPIMPRKYDMGTQIATAVQQGAQNFRSVRVTDGTDTAAQLTLPGTSFSFTAAHTGSLGNQIVVALSTGSAAGTWRLTVSLPGLQPESLRQHRRNGRRVLGRARSRGQCRPRPAARPVATGHRLARRHAVGTRAVQHQFLDRNARQRRRGRYLRTDARRRRHPAAAGHVCAAWPGLQRRPTRRHR